MPKVTRADENTAEPRTQRGELPGPGAPLQQQQPRAQRSWGLIIAPTVPTAVGQGPAAELCALWAPAAPGTCPLNLHLRSSAGRGTITWWAGTPCGQQWDCGIPHQVA